MNFIAEFHHFQEFNSVMTRNAVSTQQLYDSHEHSQVHESYKSPDLGSRDPPSIVCDKPHRSLRFSKATLHTALFLLSSVQFSSMAAGLY